MRTIATVTAAVALTAVASAQSTTRLSSGLMDSIPSQGDLALRFSSDGRFVAFQSRATNLVPGDTNGYPDVFVVEVATLAVERVSVSSNGTQGVWGAGLPTISADGRYVAFQSISPDLVPNDTNDSPDCFVRDRLLGTTERVSVTSSGAQSSITSSSATISGDGTCVAFVGNDPLFDPSVGASGGQIYVRDLVAGTTSCVSLSNTGAPANYSAHAPSISHDGRFVAFATLATNFVAGDALPPQGGNGYDVFVRDRFTASTVFASATPSGGLSNADSDGPSLSADGRFVAFQSRAGNLLAVAEAGGLDLDVFVRDLSTGTTVCASVTPLGQVGLGASQVPALSSDGRFVVFESQALDLLPSLAVPGNRQLFRRDLHAGATDLVSSSNCGVPANGWSSGSSRDSYVPSASGDGSLVAFASYAHNLIPGDVNHKPDLFLRDFAQALGADPCTFCVAGLTTHGCTPTMTSSGTPSASLSSGFVVSVTQTEGQRIGIGVFNSAPLYALPWTPGSASYRCVPLGGRLPVISSGGTGGACDGVFAWDWAAHRAADPGIAAMFPAGYAVFLQGWFRDAGAPKGSNMSDALQFVTLP